MFGLNRKQNSLTIIILLVFLSSFVFNFLFLPKKTEAIFGVGDTVFDFTKYVQSATQFAAKHGIDLQQLGFDIKDFTKDAMVTSKEIATAYMRKALLDAITDQIIAWINGEGDPQFVSDFEGFLTDVADDAGSKWLEQQIGVELMRLACKPDWAANIRIALEKPPKFSTRARCSIGDIVENIDDFYRDFNTGGWEAWIKVSESENNPYGLYLMAYDEKMRAEQKKALSVQKDAESGGGFLSDKVCVTRTCFRVFSGEGVGAAGEPWTETGRWKKEEAEPMPLEETDPTCICDKWETRTPGKILADSLGKTLFNDSDWVKNNEKWTSYVVAITDALVNRMIKEGVLALKDGFAPGPGDSQIVVDFDSVRPETSVSVVDGWNVKIDSSEPVHIYYTLDGSTPSMSSRFYMNPIQITASTTLKWLATDYMGNKENERGGRLQSLVPPFQYSSKSAPSSAAVAVGAGTVALIVDEPATIYYTTDGTPPDTSAPKYIKAFEVSYGAILQWSAVNSNGQRETAKHAMAMPPFPSTGFEDVMNLVYPNANAMWPVRIEKDKFFELNAGGSDDPDRTNKIAMYEWDFDNNGEYDWSIIDWNRDGTFDERRCRSGARCEVDPNDNNEDSAGIQAGFNGLYVPSISQAGIIKARYSTNGTKIINLRVTDDEGLSDETTITIRVD